MECSVNEMTHNQDLGIFFRYALEQNGETSAIQS